MSLDNAKQLAENTLESLVQAVQQGRSDAVTAYLQTAAKFHRYSLGNQLLIAWQRPDASHVAGFNTWKSVGRFVRNGEKGITILAPMKLTRPAANDAEEGTTAEYVRFRTVAVFDISQACRGPFGHNESEFEQFAVTLGAPAPQPEFSCARRRIRVRSSSLIRGLPVRRRDRQRQYQ
jgi:hypothetical protein